MKIDILIGVAERGGGENIINMMIPFLRRVKGWEFRVVQLVWEEYKWTADEISFYPLLRGRKGHTLEEMVGAYASFLHENGNPDVILATAWPYMCYVGKKAAAMARAANIKIISWLHAPVERYEAAGYGGYAYLALADAHLAISSVIADGIVQNLPETVVLPVKNPVDFDRCTLVKSEPLKSNPEDKNLYFIGRIAPEKRLDVVIRGLGSTNGKWKLHIIGDGELSLKEELKQLAKSCTVEEDVQWLGWQANPWAYVSNADALVLASEFEGFPLVAIEALGNGIPVISTPVSGITEVITPGVNGYLYPMGDWQMLGEILRMISGNRLPIIQPEACKQSVAEHAKETALLDFADKVEKIYRRLP